METRAQTMVTTLRQGLVRLAVGTEPANQALIEHGRDTAGDLIGLDPHFQKPQQGPSWRTAMHGGGHQVTGQPGLDGDASGLGIANLSNHHDLGILP